MPDDKGGDSNHLPSLEDLRVGFHPAAGERGCQVGPRGHWLLTDCFLSELCAVLVLERSGSIESSGSDDGKLERDDLRAIARATLSLLGQDGAAVPIVCFLVASGEFARKRVAGWVLDAAWHDGEAVFFLAPEKCDLRDRWVHSLLVPSVRHVTGVEELDDDRFRTSVIAELAWAIGGLEDSAARRHLTGLRDSVTQVGAFGANELADKITGWVKGGVGGAP